ncbi:MAG: type I-E CRISPR-associated protein Cas5/CasD [Desulfomonilaceae bacterium]
MVFRLYGPMCSWGDVAVGGFRPSVSSPSRSAIIGMLAAALGIKRDHEDELLSLDRSISLAVEVESYGTLMVDYHTAQSPRSLSGNFFFSRKREIEAVREDTKAQATLSQREYFVDSVYRVFAWLNSNSDVQMLRVLLKALKQPRFPLYLGRKSCPPSLPLAPQILQAETLKKAIEKARFPDEIALNRLSKDTHGIYWEEYPESGLDSTQVIIRRDSPLSRHPWQFADRYISFCVLKKEIVEMENVYEQDKTQS